MSKTETQSRGVQFNFERQLPVEEAISLAKAWAHSMDLALTSRVTAVSKDTGAMTTRSTLSTVEGKLLAEGSGKGMGRQALASGLFEAIEHAASNGSLLRQPNPVLREVLLENKRIEVHDRAYTAARKLGKGLPQEVLVFHEIDADLNPIQHSFCKYPRQACDISAPILPDTGPLRALSAYTATTGTAAGTSWRDSVLHGLNEVVERDAESQFLLDINMGRKSYSTIQLDEGDPLHGLFAELTTNRGRRGAVYLLNSMSGYVFCAVSEPTTTEGELGLGASQHPRVALERALTELQQVQNATELGSTWADEGGIGLEQLEDFPNMQRIASQIFPIDQGFDLRFADLEVPTSRSLSPVLQLRLNGFTPFVREVFRSYHKDQQIVITQTLVPGLESLSNLVFGRRILPTGRLLTREVVDFLKQR